MFVLALGLIGILPAAFAATLRVCADPDNLPFSNHRREGFDNEIAEFLAHALGWKIQYIWVRQREGYLRQTLGSGICDVLMGIPVTLDRARVTRPYYRSEYVQVTRKGGVAPLGDYDELKGRRLRVGVHAAGHEGSNLPPAVALGRRGLSEMLIGFPMWSPDGESNAQGRVVDAVARKDVDMALVWGPFGGYFAARHGSRLKVTPAPSDPSQPEMPFTYEIGIGVRQEDAALAERLNRVLARQKLSIHAILARYHVPLMPKSASNSPVRASSAASSP